MGTVALTVIVLLAGLAIFVVVLVLQAVLLKSTPAKNAKVNLDNSERAIEYGRRLSMMVQKETVSGRYDSDRGKFYEFHKLLEGMFPNLHRECDKHEFNGSILFKWSGKGTHAPILLMSHQDVVEAKGKWEHEPFSGDIDIEGRVWGRGTVDTKASLFCILTAVEELIASGYKPEGDVYVASSCTEEWGGEGAPLTVKYLKEQGIKLAYVLDEGGMIIEEPIAGVKGVYGMVGVLEKGCGDIKFIARSKGGHASAPAKNTPLVRLGQFMAEVDKHYPFRSEFNPTVIEMFRRLAPNMSFGMKLVFANIGIFKPLLKKILPSISPAAGAMLHTSIAFTMAKGADGPNVLPEEACVTANMRFIPHQDADESVEIITRLARKYELETELIRKETACPVVDYKSEYFKQIEAVMAEVYPGVGISPYAMTGATDAKYYGEVSNCCLRFAPLYINGQQYASIHGINENIYQGTLPAGVDFYKRMIELS